MQEKIVTIRTIREVFASLWEQMKQRGSEPEIQIKTLPQLNEKIWGLHRKQMLVIGGRPSNAKTSLALQIAVDVAMQGKQAHFFSLEMDEESLVERLFCMLCNVSSEECRQRPMDFQKQAQDFWKGLKDLPLLITYNIGATVEELMAAIEDLPKADVVIVDYLQAIRKLDFDKMTTVNNYILEFRRLAVEKNFAGILVSQINRGAMDGERKEPMLWQLKGSGTIEEHADTVLLNHWDYFYSNDLAKVNQFKIIVGKQRNGPTGEVQVYFFPQYYRFEPIPLAKMSPEIESAVKTFNGTVKEED